MNTKYPLKTAYSPVLNRIAVTVTFNFDLHFPPDHFDHNLFKRYSSLMNTSIPLKPNMTHSRPQCQSRHNRFLIIEHNLRPKELWILFGTQLSMVHLILTEIEELQNRYQD